VTTIPRSDAGGPRRAAVIGAGFGGLAAAIRLQAAGVPTTVYEALDQPGGRAQSFQVDGYTFDAGPTVITAPGCLEELFALAGRALADYVELLPVSPFYRLLWHDGDRFDYGLSPAENLEQIRRREPRDVEGYRRFLDFSRRNFEAGYGELVATPFLHLGDMLRAAPKLLWLRADRPVYRAVASFIRDPRLREALSFHTLLIGGSPFETSSIYTLIHYLEREWGVHYPRGGTGALVAALARLFVELGGELRLSTPVRRLEVTASTPVRHRLHLDGGQVETVDLTVSNADLHHTYATLLADEPRAAPMRRRLARMRWSMSLFLVYFGTDRTYPDVAQHSIIFGPRYRGLLEDIFHGDRLPEDFSLYLHAPSVTDPALAPPGGATFYVLSPVPHLGHAPIDWEREAPAYADRILAYLERFLPDLRKHIVTRRITTPIDFRDQLGAYFGNGFSLAPHLTQSAWFRPHNRDADVPGLYIVGAGTHPGAGVPGVINSAKATARVILADLGVDAAARSEGVA
jgi:phytoene desaturase